MSSFAIASVVFSCSFGAALIGMALHIKLPDDHLDSDSRDVVKLVMGLIATMSALVLSLLIASANSSYDRQSSELKALATTSFCSTGRSSFTGQAQRRRVMGCVRLSCRRMTGSGRGRACGLRISTLGQHKTP
jgi:hypothetical protein